MNASHSIIVSRKAQIVSGILRISLGWIFLWAFTDKMFGFGFATQHSKAWIDGISPTTGFLKFGTKGPFAEIFQSLAGSAIIDWLFMLGLLGIGLALILGVCMRLAVGSGTLLLALMYLAIFTPEHNPLVDEHIIYLFALQLLLGIGAGEYLGLGNWWSKTAVVQKYAWLR